MDSESRLLILQEYPETPFKQDEDDCLFCSLFYECFGDNPDLSEFPFIACPLEVCR